MRDLGVSRSEPKTFFGWGDLKEKFSSKSELCYLFLIHMTLKDHPVSSNTNDDILGDI